MILAGSASISPAGSAGVSPAASGKRELNPIETRYSARLIPFASFELWL